MRRVPFAVLHDAPSRGREVFLEPVRFDFTIDPAEESFGEVFGLFESEVFGRSRDGAADSDGDAGVFGGLFFFGDLEVQAHLPEVWQVVLFGKALAADVSDPQCLVIDEDGEVGFAPVVEHEELLEALRVGEGEVLGAGSTA